MVGYDDRHIVDRAPFKRQRDKQIARALRRVFGRKSEDLVIRDMRGQPIAADDEDVVLFENPLDGFWIELWIDPNRAGDDIAAWPSLRFLRAQDTLGNQFGDLRMVA